MSFPRTGMLSTLCSNYRLARRPEHEQITRIANGIFRWHSRLAAMESDERSALIVNGLTEQKAFTGFVVRVHDELQGSRDERAAQDLPRGYSH